MKQEMTMVRPVLGGSGLLVIFAVLYLVVFSLLSLQTVLAQQRLSQANARQVTDWHAADLRAQETFARLRSGEVPEGVTRSDKEYHYSVAISGHQTLQVIVTETNGCWEILSWQTVAHPEDGNTALPVWQEGN